MTTILMQPGAVDLADWRKIYRGAAPELDPASRPAVQASADAVARIVARGAPVYGINTGFGKLASVRIGAADLATLQRNIVLSHAAGVGAAMPVAVTRLMMALKLASLGQGASGVQPATLDGLQAMLANDIIPVVPARGSVGASGDLAPLAHMAAVMMGVGEASTPHGGFAGARGVRTRRACAACSRHQGRARPSQRHAVLDRLCAGGAVRGGNPVSLRALVTGALVHGRGARFGHPVRSAHSPPAQAPRPGRNRGAPCDRYWPAAQSAPRTWSVTNGCRIRIACAASRR